MQKFFSLITLEKHHVKTTYFSQAFFENTKSDGPDFLKPVRGHTRLFAERFAKQIGAKLYHLTEDRPEYYAKHRFDWGGQAVVGSLRGKKIFLCQTKDVIRQLPNSDTSRFQKLKDLVEKRLSEGKAVIHVAMSSHIASGPIEKKVIPADCTISYDPIRDHERVLAVLLKKQLTFLNREISVKLNSTNIRFESQILKELKVSHSTKEYRGLQLDIHPKAIGRYGTVNLVKLLSDSYLSAVEQLDGVVGT